MENPKAKKIARLEESDLHVPGAFADVLFSRGVHTLAISKKLHAENREKYVNKMRVALAVDEVAPIVVFKGGVSRCRNDSDFEELFRQESYFQYLFGVKEPDWYGSIDIQSGEARLFAPRLPSEFAIWMGKIASAESLSAKYGVPVIWIDAMDNFLNSFTTQAKISLQGTNSDSDQSIENALTWDRPHVQTVLSSLAFNNLAECRVIKSSAEIEVVRYACYSASRAHVAVMKSAKPGDYEYQLEARFLAACYEKQGCRNVAYTSICACGPNGAILHYGHAGEPNAGRLEEDHMALLDMGCEYHCYCSDITCSFPARGEFSSDQRIIYQAVLNAQRAVIAAAKPGVSWVAMHELAEKTILCALQQAGILIPDLPITKFLDADIGALFMPHGLGHFIGLDTHDVGGYLPGHPQRSKRPGKSKLRTSRILQPGMLLTIEPGCYFIDALLDPALQNPETARFFVPHVLSRFRGFGGVRLEDVVLITNAGLSNLTLCPRTIDEVEGVMSGSLEWPPPTDTAPELQRAWGSFKNGAFHHEPLL
uniref:Xaa-Pro dipeptidase n=1 Tax=Aureoumbra lagunensis TaxID=44058 RepID=A0A7S3ND60_9STRA|mmetsp:Transcript_7005/g.9822  ORF Transcript_7005/g.9822 Transcript_7005/m.9822 type:complete len:537 (-) Transcript_7005:139-1749(-)|eukprot:CAMPEP_0197304200 /NCGR_PEP_ID=MMETSP0890-20130614/52116_1 /TAXON_ID=44058 ORGANISM="Aureoumbra lagunensis, Strain CCMP1510" /NCGR_SAMPLE_ID=MMETSP0890 /ASSEMBLY_ACC=CAM_ASM_000533 /LENGTH=536 /DNA_ID=CAMNT_0042784183 /DNA_START=44 /DNA_END=1654 /DNA_ORIENTATION=-